VSDESDSGKPIARPWEASEDEPAVELPAEEDVEQSLSALESGPTSLDDFTDEDYLSTSTQEYRGLAESVAAADTQEFPKQAVAAALPGVGTGLIGFEDVTGERGLSEEDVETVEQRRTTDLTIRVVSAVVLAAVFVATLVLGGAWFTGFVLVAMMVSLGEFYASVRTVGYNPLALFGLIGVIGGAIAADAYGTTGLYGWVIVTIGATAFFFSMAQRRNPLDDAGITIMGLVWVSLLGFAIVIGRSDFAVPVILLTVLGTAGFDIGAYFIGKTFGKRQLAPSVSPNKTVEGLVGGVLATTALLTVLSTFPYFDPLTVGHAAIFALGICILAPLGDAAESVVKRSIGVKDMGSIMPGHGGILDRIDAILFVAPFAYYLFELLDYL
jgi:phosphatidate cytidylyltransferase